MTEREFIAYQAHVQARHAAPGSPFITVSEYLALVVGPRRRPNRGVWSVPQGRKTEDGREGRRTEETGVTPLAGSLRPSDDLPLDPFYLPYEFTSVLIEAGNTNPFGIDPEATTVIA